MLKDTNKKILYLSYDGVLEPLGSSQVLNYVLGLAKSYNFILYSFEKPYDLKDTKRVSAVSKIIKNSGIKWIKSIYHKSPTTLATLYDLFILLSNLILILSFNKISSSSFVLTENVSLHDFPKGLKSSVVNGKFLT